MISIYLTFFLIAPNTPCAPLFLFLSPPDPAVGAGSLFNLSSSTPNSLKHSCSTFFSPARTTIAA